MPTRSREAPSAQCAPRLSEWCTVSRLHQDIVAEANEGIVVYDAELRYVVWNRFMEQLSGLPAERVLGQCALDLSVPIGAPEGPRLLQQALHGEGVTTPDIATRHVASGRHLLVCVDLRPRRNPAGKIVGVIGLVYDVTRHRQAEEALRLSEQRYRALVEDASDIIYETDVQGRFLYFNQNAAFRMLGFSLEDVIGKNYLDLVEPGYRETVSAFYREQFVKRTRLTYLELPVRAKAGRTVWLGQNVRLIAEEGWVQRFHVVARDVTERRARDAELEQSRGQLRELSAHLQSALEAERSRIAREIHDELGSRLTALRMAISECATMASTTADVPQAKITAILADVSVAIDTVRTIASQLRPSILDTFGVWEAIEWQAQEFEERTGIACRLALEADEVELDPDRATAVFRIVQEALTNVARHARAGKVRITARLRESCLVVDIMDDGTGIKPAEAGQRRSFGMLGMQERARMFGGSVEIRTWPGTGTRVELSLPLQVAQP